MHDLDDSGKVEDMEENGVMEGEVMFKITTNIIKIPPPQLLEIPAVLVVSEGGIFKVVGKTIHGLFDIVLFQD